MGDYFKPLRRKIGVVTLAMACLFAAGWVRSRFIVDQITFTRNVNCQEVFQSVNSCLVWFPHRENVADFESVPMIEWNGGFFPASDMFFVPDNPNPNTSKIKWRFRAPGIGIGHFSNLVRQPGAYFMSYWLIVIPLTLLSAYLLLSRPPAPKPVSLVDEKA